MKITEGMRKLVMTSLAIVAFVAIIITWMITAPPGLDFLSLATAAGTGLMTLLGIGVGGNVLEHRYKSGSSNDDDGDDAPPRPPAASTLMFFGAGLVAFGLLLSGCGGSQAGDLSFGELVPEARISKTPAGCVEVEVAQNLPAPDGWKLKTTATATQVCEGGEKKGDQN